MASEQARRRRRAARPALDPRLRAHLPAPDYSRPLLQVTPEQRSRILGLLEVLYGRERAEACWPEIERLMKVYWAYRTPEMIAADRGCRPAERLTERDVVLITYGDLIASPGKTPLRALSDFLDRYMRDAVSTVHILPFFPYSSDRGFAVVDFEDVDPRLGSWAEIETLASRFRLMFDGVFNHVSSKSKWFQRFLNRRPGYEDYFISFSTREAVGPDHLELILRPRTSDLLTPFRTMDGVRWVWTTFGPDQVDLNFKYERVLQRVVEILVIYLRKGADLVRLDAVTYIWHELGTRCAHLEQTHALVRLFRAILDVVAPHVALVTETNVPLADNISYFGDGRDEAQLVYNFSLPPLVLHAVHTGSAKRLSRWAAELPYPSDTTSYLNFLDSHDGVGLMGAQGILTPEEIESLVERAKAHGGLVSYRDRGDGTRSPYELNVTWYSALNRDDAGEAVELQVDRFLATRAIALALRGVAGIYLPSVFGARNDTAAVLAGQEARSINRRVIDEQSLLRLLEDRDSREHLVASGLRRLVKRRIACPAFHPNAPQRVLDLHESVLALLRTSPDGSTRVLALTSVSDRPCRLAVPAEVWPGGTAGVAVDLVTRRLFRPAASGPTELELPPYGVLWLSPWEGRPRPPVTAPAGGT